MLCALETNPLLLTPYNHIDLAHCSLIFFFTDFCSSSLHAYLFFQSDRLKKNPRTKKNIEVFLRSFVLFLFMDSAIIIIIIIFHHGPIVDDMFASRSVTACIYLILNLVFIFIRSSCAVILTNHFA